MKNFLITLSSAAALLLFGGCAMMPYEENFSCNSHIGLGTCTSVSENYYISKKLHSKSVYEKHMERFGEPLYGAEGEDERAVVILRDGTELTKN